MAAELDDEFGVPDESDETKAAIVKKSSAAAHAAVVLNASPRFDNLLVSPLSNLNMIADAAATAEPSMMVRDEYMRGVVRRSDSEIECDQIPNSNNGSDPRITSAVHRLEALMQPVAQRKDGGFQAIIPKESLVQPPTLHQQPNSYPNLHAQYTQKAQYPPLQYQQQQQPQPHSQQQYYIQNQPQIQYQYVQDTNNAPHVQQQHQQQHQIHRHQYQQQQQQQPTQPQMQPTSAPLNMTAITTQLHLNPTQIPPPQSFTHPTLGPTVSWTSNLLAEVNLDPHTDLTDTQRRVFTQCDALILAAVKERNQFLEISRALVQECGKHREIGVKYLGILRQLVGIVPANVRVGVKMDLEAIERFSRTEVSVVNDPISVMRSASVSSLSHHKYHASSSRQQSSERFEGYEFQPVCSSASSNVYGKRVGSPMSVSSDKRMRGNSIGSGGGSSESPDMEYRGWKSSTPELEHAVLQTAVPTVGDSPVLNSVAPTSVEQLPPASSILRCQRQPQELQQQQFHNMHQSRQQLPPFPSAPVLVTSVPISVSIPQQQRQAPIRKNLPPIMQVNPPHGYKQSTKVVNKDVVCAMALSRPFKYLFTASGGSIKIWDISVTLEEAPQVGTIELNTNTKLGENKSNYIRAIKITADGKTLVAGGEGQDVSICNINTTQPHVTAKLPTYNHDTYTITLSHDSQTTLIGGRDNQIHLWDLSTYAKKLSFTGHTAAVTCTALSRDGKKLYSGSCDSTIRLWDVATGECLEKFGFRSGVHGFDLNPLIPILTVGLEDGVVQRYLTRDVVGRNGGPASVGATQASVTTHFAGGEDGVYLDVGESVEGGSNTAPWSCVRYSRSGLWFAVAGMNGKMYVFKEGNLGAGSEINGGAAVKMCEIGGGEDLASIICAEVSSCGNYVVMGCGNQTANVFRVMA
ncbi:UNVERIFIED_CONTAM: hypothetical protein HDU68_001786 [Siphonaria sp. JEL0065]|nr:hypothetical protein HDU68_001786 [Siphonaria sp. JEL0065]